MEMFYNAFFQYPAHTNIQTNDHIWTFGTSVKDFIA